jgi:ribokinase
MTTVSVVGSLHLDIMVEAPRLPRRDETLIGSAWHTKCGGKGGNQAVAAARLGANTAFGGRIGNDDFGRRLKANLNGAGVDTSCLDLDAATASGMSVAISEEAGEYGAVVVSGANQTIEPNIIKDRWSALWDCKVLLLQNEIPQDVNLVAAREARVRKAIVILNAAPARPLPPGLLGLVDLLIVNRVEAEMLTGRGDLNAAINALHSPSHDVVLTMGGDGLILKSKDGQATLVHALPVTLLASHGAGDCFSGAVAARLAAGDGLLDACHFAAAAAALLVSTPTDKQKDLDTAAVRRLMVRSNGD